MAVNMEIRREASTLKKQNLQGLVGDGEGDDSSVRFLVGLAA